LDDEDDDAADTPTITAIATTMAATAKTVRTGLDLCNEIRATSAVATAIGRLSGRDAGPVSPTMLSPCSRALAMARCWPDFSSTRMFRGVRSLMIEGGGPDCTCHEVHAAVANAMYGDTLRITTLRCSSCRH
jgi:hypothetical protein